MSKRALKIMSLVLACASVLSLAACGTKNTDTSDGTAESGAASDAEKYQAGELSYYSYDSNDKEVNKNLFYVNSSMEWGADPSLLFVPDEDGDGGGTYYIYCTSGYINTAGIEVWRSRNLTDWECLGPAFMPDVDTNWSYKGFWAPQCIYDEEFGKYYLFYSAPWGSNSTLRYDSCAVADRPEGPFYEITSDKKSAKEPLLQFELHQDEYDPSLISPAIGYYGISGFIKVIGPSPFIDPETGRRYLFFVADLGTANNDNTSGAYCIEMEDWATPKYETLTRITRYGYTTANGDTPIIEGGSTNEGPMCYYKDGKYYLIFLTYTYYNTKYQTRAAVADSPMGPYTKFDLDDGAQVIYTDFNFQRQAVGIHGLANAGDALFGAYMTFMNNVNYDDLRKFAIDEIVFVNNKEGIPTMHANGPSVTPQALPEAISGYRDLAPEAKVDCDNIRFGSDIKYLTDRVIPYHDNDLAPEFLAGDGTTTITFDFDDYRTLRSVMVYNSRDYNEMFSQVESITFDYRKNGQEGQVTIGPVRYNWDYYNLEENKPAVGSAAIAEFDELDVKSVRIEIINPGNMDGIGIPEIILLGKDSDGSSASQGEEKGALYEPYTFENEEIRSNWKNVPTELAVDTVLNEEYGDPVYRLYADNDETSETYADLYMYAGNDGIYTFVDVNNSTLEFDPKKTVSENPNVTLFFAKYNTGLLNRHTAGFRVDISNETYRYRGVYSQKAWLRSWCDGATEVRIKNGSIDDLGNATGYYVETFIPYEVLDITERENVEKLRVYFSMFSTESTDVIKRELNYVARNASQSDPTTWLRIDLKKEQ